MKPLYVRRLSPRYRGIPLHGHTDGPAPAFALASDGGGTVCRRMLGYGLLAARIEEMGGAVGCETRGG